MQTAPSRLPLEPANGIPVQAHGRAVGYLFVGSMLRGGETPVRDEIGRILFWSSAISVPLVLMGAALVARAGSRWLLRPIRSLADASRDLASGDRSVRIALPRGNHELRSMVANFNMGVEEIDRQESLRRQFIADAAHELRTPVHLISARIEMLQNGVYQPDRKQFDALYDSTERIARLVDDLQTLAHIDAGTLRISIQACDIGESLRAIRNEFLPETDRLDVSLLVHEPDGPPVVGLLDPGRLAQVLRNLVSNALRYGESVEPIQMRYWDQTGTLRIDVSNGGPGIPEADRERVMHRFVRLDQSRSRETGGSGLGLSISRDIVTLLGGTMWIEGPGTRVCLAFPGAIANR